MKPVNYLQAKNRFYLLRKKLKEIDDLKVIIHGDYDEYIVEFFKRKGVKLKMVNNPYSPLRYYNMEDVLLEYIMEPTFYISPLQMTIEFRWQKKANKHPNICVWDPTIESLDTYYQKKLRKVFKPPV